jgi:alcohol dehydrogenase
MTMTFHLPAKIIFGVGSIEELGEEAKGLGHRAMVVTYPDIRRVGLLDRVLRDLTANEVAAVVFDRVEPNPRSSTVDEGALIAREERVDLLVGLGGGSAMDTAKGIALGCASGEPVWARAAVRDSAGARDRAVGPAPAIVQVPTMAGTGAEVNAGAVITNWSTHQKGSVAHNCMWAKVAIIDPEITLTVPRRQTAAGGVDIFSHLVEPYLMPAAPLPVNDALREAVMRVVVDYLPRALERLDDIEARTQLSWASTIAMSQFARLGGSVGSMTCHGIEHAVSGLYDVTHGEGLAALLPAWMRHLATARQARVNMLGRNVFGESDGIAATGDWLQSIGMRLRLRDLGCRLEDASQVAASTLKTFRGLRLSPRKLDAEAIEQIYRESY